MLRGSRKAFKDHFEKSGLAKGTQHWDDDKWFSKCKIFLEEHLGFMNINVEEICACVILIYPNLGPILKKGVIHTW